MIALIVKKYYTIKKRINQMKHTSNNEKSKDFLRKIGNTLHEQRTIVSKKDLKQFSIILTEFSGHLYSENIIEKMEQGNPEIPIINWIHIWQYFQNIDRIVNAYDAKEMMYLAQQEFLPDIEREILAHHNKENK